MLAITKWIIFLVCVNMTSGWGDRGVWWLVTITELAGHTNRYVSSSSTTFINLLADYYAPPKRTAG